MRRKAVLAALTALVLGLAGTIIVQASPHTSWVADALARAALRSGLKEAAGAVPLVQRIVGARRLARGDGSAAAPATVQTDKGAYLPGSEVIATGSGWSNNVVVTLTYTEIATTDPKGLLNGPVTVFASTDGSGSFSSAGDPNAKYKTSTSQNASVTVQLTASGTDASGTAVSVNSATFTNGVTLTTDNNKYAVGQPMTISGAGFTGGSSVTVTVLLPDHTTDTLPASVNADGTFSVVYAPPPVPGRYKITATDGVYTAETAATEADAIAVDFRQCANNDPSNTGVNLGQCHWINSILQSSNARIFEGMSTLQRLILTDVPASTNAGNYRIQFHTDALKAASHAYDFITTWETTIDATNELAPPGITQPVPLYPDTPPASLKLRTPEANALACGEEIAAPQKPFCLALRNAANPNVTYADLDPDNVDNFDPVIGDTVGDKLSAYQARYGVPLYGAGNEKHAVKFYSNAAIDAAVFTLLGYDSQGNANYELRWHSAGVPTQVLIEFAAHVAVGNDTIGYGVGYGAGRGAANISGGPYHVSIDLADFGCDAGSACGGSNGHADDANLGSQDNQLKGADVLVPPKTPTVTTQVRNASNADITNQTVDIGTVVHDHATIATGSSINLIPNGSTVDFLRFDNGICSGTPVSSQLGVAVPSGAQTGQVDSNTFTTNTAGSFAYLVNFHSGNTAILLDATGVCEPFNVRPNTPTISTTLSSSSIPVGGTVHDSAALTGATGDAGGTVTYAIYTDNTCSTLAATQPSPATVTVTNGTVPDSGNATFNTAGTFYWQATYSGDANNTGPVSSACTSETLLVLDANIQITPAAATNAVGTNHTLTITVNAVGGTIAAGGGTATASITSGPGSFVGASSCSYAGGAASASCTVVITSAATGTTVVSATSDIPLAGDGSVTRTTNGTAGNSGPASKTWVDANIQITPATATNAVGTNHTLTITVNAVNGTITAGGGTATASITSGPGSFVGASSCSYAGGAASASCTVVITSAATGTTVVSATSSIPLAGDGSVTRTTNGTAGNSGPASKTWVDANIQITPATATNAVGTNHTLTITVNAVNGTITAGGGTATASIASGPGSFVGGNTCTYAGGGASASCTVVITSATTGTTVVSATSSIPLAGDGSVTRTTDGTAGNSGPASKTWVDANIQITPAAATNAVGTTHTLTITVNAVNGTITAGGGTATASIASGPGSFVGGNTCTYAGGGASASCTVVITSATTGTTVVSATSSIPLAGDGSVTRTTNGSAGNSGPASKTWVDANIQITPAAATNAVGTNHTLTITVNAVNGTITAGGGTATASITSGPGSFVGGNTCTYAGGGASASCTVVITSATTGTTVVSATSSIPLAGDGSVTRTTNGTAGNSGPASKTWVDANIQITPAAATNAVGTTHTLTITVNAVNGTITAGGGTATASIASGPGSFVGGNTCTYAGGGASASCTVVITSATTGTTVVSATSSIPLAGDGSVTRTTDGTAGNSGPASKTWVDANIQITPAAATNAVGTTHTLTITVNAVNGTITAGGGTATASIASGPGSFVGGNTCTYAGGGASASCTVVITSATTGTTVVSATSSIPLAGDGSVTRTTNGTAGNSGPASKTWVDANIQITPATATNAVGTNHTLTITVNAVNGTITAGGGTATASITSGPGSFVGASSCSYAGGAASASCTVVITSAATGTTVVSATSSIPLAGDGSVTRTTNGTAGNSGPASKTWVDANIQITPATATNAVGTNHTLTITVNAVNGTITSGGGTATASITSGPGSFVGASSCSYAGGAASASCTVVITSAATGTTVVSATSSIPLAGDGSVTRTTNGTAGNSGPASKTWVNANIQITPAAATNPVGTNHVLIITVNALNGVLGSGTATASLVSGPGSFVGSPTCSYTGGGSSASCTVTITSIVAGTTVVSATSTIPVSGVPITRTTGTAINAAAGGSDNATKTWVDVGPCPTGPLGGVMIGGLTNDLFFFGDGRLDANWQSSSPGYVGNVTVNGVLAKLRTSGSFAYAGTISTNAPTLAAWQQIVDNNPGQAFASYGQTALVDSRNAELNQAFLQINALAVTPGFESRSATSLNGLNTQNGVSELIVINVTSGFQVTQQVHITGDAGDVYVLRWDTDANFSNGYQGQVKFQSGGAIVPMGNLTPGNFISVAGDINSSGGGSTPPPPYPQGPRLDNGLGVLINGAKDFNGGGFFTGYWLTTGAPVNPADATHVLPYGPTANLSNGIFVGGWYTYTTKFSMTSGTAGVHVCPNPAALRSTQSASLVAPTGVQRDGQWAGATKTFDDDLNLLGEKTVGEKPIDDRKARAHDDRAGTLMTLGEAVGGIASLSTSGVDGSATMRERRFWLRRPSAVTRFRPMT